MAIVESASWHACDGVRGFRWTAPDGVASLLLQHGLGEYSERYVARYSGLIPCLVAIGFDVYAFDLRGHGRSPGPRGDVDVGEAVAQHGTARRRLAHAGKPLYLFGHSLGGLITAASLASDPAGVAGAILSAPAVGLDAGPLRRLVVGAIAAMAPGLGIQSPYAAAGISRISEEVVAYESDPRIFRGMISARLGTSAVAVARSTRRRAGHVGCPLLIMHGSADTFTSAEGSRQLYDAVSSPDKTLSLYDEGRHELLNDLPRDAALAEISGWLSSRLRGIEAMDRTREPR